MGCRPIERAIETWSGRGIVVRQIALHCCARLVLFARQGKQHRPNQSHEEKSREQQLQPAQSIQAPAHSPATCRRRSPWRNTILALWPGNVRTEPHRLVGIGNGLFRLTDKSVGQGQSKLEWCLELTSGRAHKN